MWEVSLQRSIGRVNPGRGWVAPFWVFVSDVAEGEGRDAMIAIGI
jgi:hypothetical protein